MSLKYMVISGALLILMLPCMAQVKTHKTTKPVSAKPETWTKEKAEAWLKGGTWRHGLKLNPDESVNVLQFAQQYNKSKSTWDKAFAFLRNPGLDTLKPGKYPVDGENAYAMVSEGPTKPFEETKWEAHRKYIDLQYVIQGKEKMGKAPLSKATETIPFNIQNDIGGYSVGPFDSQFYTATPDKFLIFFPGEVHRPGIMTEGILKTKKVVIKILKK